MKELYKDIFTGVEKIYWLPSYLAREDPQQHVLTPQELICYLADPSIAQASDQDDALLSAIKQHADSGALVLCLAGGGGGSLDEFIKANLAVQ